ncbi:MAG: alpha-amylase family glycosyl hydrolase [bacterium]|nr:alpha-amylase family glycosyl hydrolase [bacterium]
MLKPGPSRPRTILTTIALFLSVFIAFACSSGSKDKLVKPDFNGPNWYKHVVFYHIWVRSFLDTNGDGIGDLPGITRKLDYIQSLGIGGIWISPFYPTPYFDSGYDVADYTAINPDYGTLADFDELLAEAHQRGLRVFTDMVMNHTSIEHAWFKESRSSKTNPKRDWYVWAAVPNIPCVPSPPFGESAWTYDATTGEYYFHHFYPEQPDLNYRNPEVQEAMLDVLRFWLDRGVDGFRFDAIDTMFEDEGTSNPAPDFICLDHPLVYEYVKRIRTVLDEYPDRASVAEIWADPVTTANYFGNGSNGFHETFSLTLTLAFQGTVLSNGAELVPTAIQESSAPLPPNAQYGIFLSNHDFGRVMGRANNDPRRATLAAVMLFSLPGTPFVYYGDEVGLANGTDEIVDVRDQFRTPMPWTSGPGVGFTTGTPWLDPSPGSDTANVASEEDDPESFLNLYRKLISLHNKLDLFGTGTFEAISATGAGPGLLVYARVGEKGKAIVALNFSEQSQNVMLDLSKYVTSTAKSELYSEMPPKLNPANATSYSLTLPAYGYVIWSVK